MPYDSSMDKKLFSKSFETETDRVTVSVFSYNNGPKKLQITRENKGPEGDYRFTKLGRMTKEEVEGILPLIQESTDSLK